jgi:hypothetical protein
MREKYFVTNDIVVNPFFKKLLATFGEGENATWLYVAPVTVSRTNGNSVAVYLATNGDPSLVVLGNFNEKSDYNLFDEYSKAYWSLPEWFFEMMSAEELSDKLFQTLSTY